jgi:hypothetical protein
MEESVKERHDVAKSTPIEKHPSRLMELLKENLTCEMYHALLDIINSKHYIIKIHLSIFLLISYGLASYMTIELIMNYFNYGVTTSIRTIYETPALFPKVTFCNLNQFTTKFAYEFLNSSEPDLLSSFANMNFYNRSQTFWKLIFKLNDVMENNTDDFKRRMSHDLNDIMIGCRFNYQVCTAEDFVWSWNSFYGNFFSFNSGSDSTPLKYSDIGYGLELDIYVNFYENLSYSNSILSGKGAIILIDNVTHLVDHIFDGIYVSAGMATNIGMRREIKTILPKPYSDCLIDQGKDTVFDSYFYNLIKKSPFDYSAGTQSSNLVILRKFT